MRQRSITPRVTTIVLFAFCSLSAAPLASEPTDPDASESQEISDTRSPAATDATESVVVTRRADDLVGLAQSASEGVTGRADLAIRPIARAGDLLETVPGAVLTQHSGAGKGQQILLRGFDLDHGTDLAVSVAGIPWNLPSHGHGQGYVDLNGLVAELISAIRYEKGPYRAERGAYAVTGAVEIDYAEELQAPRVELTSGRFGSRRLFAGGTHRLPDGATLTGGAAWSVSDGPWQHPEDARSLAGAARYTRRGAAREFSLLGTFYDARWNATEQLPLRAVASGRVGRFGSLDDTLGGDTTRLGAAARWRSSRGRTLDEVTAWAEHYRLDLVSNFTYRLDDPVRGDRFGQTDRRVRAGASWRRQRFVSGAGRWAGLAFGASSSAEAIDVALERLPDGGSPEAVRRDRIASLAAGAFAEVTMRPAPRFELALGVRGDALAGRVHSAEHANSGRASGALISPRARLALRVSDRFETYLDLGRGFHDNDLRGATIRVDPASGERARRVRPLAGATGAEIGLRARAGARSSVTAALFAVETSSELVYSGDGGGTEAVGPARRTGLEVTQTWRPRSWLAADIDLSWTRARFRNGPPSARRVPGAPRFVAAAGVTVGREERTFATLRMRRVGSRPLEETGRVRAPVSTLWNLRAGHRVNERLRVGLDLLNLFDTPTHDAIYLYRSRLPGEPLEGVEDLHLHPTTPRALTLTVAISL